jgi:Flp pilus assembly protein TadB
MVEHNSETQKSQETVFRKIGRGLGKYLTDWRNLLGHSLLGIVFLVLAIWAPVNIWIKLIVIACLITFNVIRMRRKAKRAALKVAVEDEKV